MNLGGGETKFSPKQFVKIMLLGRYVYIFLSVPSHHALWIMKVGPNNQDYYYYKKVSQSTRERVYSTSVLHIEHHFFSCFLSVSME